MKRKKAVTMIEVMIVILLIGIISGVLAYNFKGSLTKGKEFKTKEGAERIRNILMLAVAEGKSLQDVVKNWEIVVKESPYAAKADQLIKDGWGDSYQVQVSSLGDDILVTSSHMNINPASSADFS